jgi:hypothetical protein
MAIAKVSKLKPRGAHFRTLEGCLIRPTRSNVRRAIREAVIIQKIKEGAQRATGRTIGLEKAVVLRSDFVPTLVLV